MCQEGNFELCDDLCCKLPGEGGAGGVLSHDGVERKREREEG